MALRLRIVSDHRRHLGDRSTKVFGAGGGTIGRSADNDWVLPDPLRYVSAHHARIRFQNGQYYIDDLSTNGVYVNDDTQPLGKHNTYRLRHGDVLRLGEYQIVVTIGTEPEYVDDTGDMPAVPTSIQVLRGLGRAAQTDIGASLDLEQLLMPADPPPNNSFQPVNAYGQAVAVASRPEAVRTEPDEEAVARRIARLAKAAGRDPKTGASAPALYDVQSGLQAFCRGAGIDAEQLPADAQTRLLHLAGQLVREALVGLKDLERARNEIRNRFRIDVPPADPDDPRPSLARSTIEELLIQLFRQHESRRLDAVQWLREALAGAKMHESAMAQAMRTAFVAFLERLDPAELETRFGRAIGRTKHRVGDPTQFWELYAEFYRNLTEMPADHLPHTFVEAFANAYQELLKKSSQ